MNAEDFIKPADVVPEVGIIRFEEGRMVNPWEPSMQARRLERAKAAIAKQGKEMDPTQLDQAIKTRKVELFGTPLEQPPS